MCVKFSLTISVFIPVAAHAQIVISEALFDPAGSDTHSEWIEIYNLGDTVIDISKWKIAAGSSPAKHPFNSPPKNGGTGTSTIAARSYAIIARDAASVAPQFPNVSVIDSAFNLPNPKKGIESTVLLFDASNAPVDTFSYSVCEKNSGDSAQRSSLPSGTVECAPATGGSPYVPKPVSKTPAQRTAVSVNSVRNEADITYPSVKTKTKSTKKTSHKSARLAMASPKNLEPEELVLDSGAESAAAEAPAFENGSSTDAVAFSFADYINPWTMALIGLILAGAIAAFMSGKMKDKEWEVQDGFAVEE